MPPLDANFLHSYSHHPSDRDDLYVPREAFLAARWNDPSPNVGRSRLGPALGVANVQAEEELHNAVKHAAGELPAAGLFDMQHRSGYPAGANHAIRLAHAPMINHWWQVPLYVTSRGLTTSIMPYGARGFQIDFDFIDHALVIRTSDGATETVALAPRCVADFHAEVMGRLRGLGRFCAANCVRHRADLDRL